MQEQNPTSDQTRRVAETVNSAAEVMKFLATAMMKDQEVSKNFEGVVSAIKDVRDNLMKAIDSGDRQVMRQCQQGLAELEAKINSELGGSMAQREAEMRKLVGDVSSRMAADIAKVKASIPEPTDLTPVYDRIDGLDIITMKDVEDALPKFGESFRNGLELLKGDDRLDRTAIKGLEDELKRISSTRTTTVVGGRTGGYMMPYDLSSQTTGSLKVFTVPKSRTAVIMGSDFPTVLMEGNGFTLNATRTQATLTVTNAPSSGSQLLFLYSSVFNP